MGRQCRGWASCPRVVKLCLAGLEICPHCAEHQLVPPFQGPLGPSCCGGRAWATFVGLAPEMGAEGPTRPVAGAEVLQSRVARGAHGAQALGARTTPHSPTCPPHMGAEHLPSGVGQGLSWEGVLKEGPREPGRAAEVSGRTMEFAHASPAPLGQEWKCQTSGLLGGFWELRANPSALLVLRPCCPPTAGLGAASLRPEEVAPVADLRLWQQV